MFMSMGPHQAYGNIPRSIEFAVGWIAECIEYCRDHNIAYVEAKEQSVGLIKQLWVQILANGSRYEIGPVMSMT